MKDKNQKSRLWKFLVAGQVDKMVLVARGFNVANGLAIRDGHVYVTGRCWRRNRAVDQRCDAVQVGG